MKRIPTKSTRIETAAASAIALLAALWFWLSSLSFFPVPWPDDSAFYLVAVEWLNWPSVYRMHSQAPFVPSYDEANFNTMPGLPLILGLGRLLGIDTLHDVRVYGYVLLAAWALLLFLWARKRGVAAHWRWLILFAALFSPVVKWGAGLVRPEIWQGLIGTLILMDLDGFFRKPSKWRIPLLLAFGAYIHFQAIIWVPMVAIAVFPFASGGSLREKLIGWWRELISVGWRTGALLSPWAIYVLANFGLFTAQMEVQFGRLQGIENSWTRDLYGLFHSIFLDYANPVNYPKFFNLGKAITWGVLLWAAVRSLYLIFGTRAPEARRQIGLRAGAVSALAVTLYLWITHPEVWFITLIHVALWPAVVAAFRTHREIQEVQEVQGVQRIREGATAGLRRRALLGGAAAVAVALLAIIQIGVAVRNWHVTRETYSWQTYSRWIDCIDAAVGSRQIVWLPTHPDVLVELASRNPGRDYYRHVDFPGTQDLVASLADRAEAIISAWGFHFDQAENRRFYEGPPTREDIEKLKGVAYSDYSGLTRGSDWSMQTCHAGPFWAVVSLRASAGEARKPEL